MIKAIFISIAIGLLVGCQVIEEKGKKNIIFFPSPIPDSERYLSEAADIEKIKKIKLYENQLIVGNQKYAMLTTIPYKAYQYDLSISFNPLMLHEIDGVKVKYVKNTFFGSSSVFKFEYSQAKLKIPIGKHSLVLIHNFGHHFYYTEIKEIFFEEGKDYIIGENDGKAFIAEYTVDYRFKRTDPDSIVIKNKIIQDVEIGNLKYVKNY